MPSKTIVHWAKFYPPEWGGMESVTHVLAKGAAAHGHAVTVVAFANRQGSGCQNIDGVRVIRCKSLKTVASQPISPRWLWSAIRHARQCDIVHIHVPNMFAALALPFIGKAPRVVLHWHSDVIGKGWLGKILQPMERAMLRRADTVIATSPPYALASVPLRDVQGKIAIIPLGIDDPLLGDLPSQLPLGIKAFVGDRKLILSVGRLVPYKGFATLIAAARALSPDLAIVVVGSGPLEAELKGQIQASGVSDRVLLSGGLSASALAAVFNATSLYVMTSIERSEAFGVVLIEAMAYGLPVIATQIQGSGVPWVNEDDVSGCNVPVLNASALAEAVNKILSDSVLYSALAKGARTRFTVQFSSEKMLEKTLSLYDTLIPS